MKTKQAKIDRYGAALLPGAMALAATTAGAQAAIVQITLSGNKISSGGNQLNADLTGDVKADVSFAGPVISNAFVGVNVNGANVMAAFEQYFNLYFADGTFAGASLVIASGASAASQPTSNFVLNPISFEDDRINGGQETYAWLEVHAFNTSSTDHTVALTRLIFDDASTTRPSFSSIPGVQTEWGQVSAIPEPGGFVATSLLLGAAGLIRRRQMRAA